MMPLVCPAFFIEMMLKDIRQRFGDLYRYLKWEVAYGYRDCEKKELDSKKKKSGWSSSYSDGGYFGEKIAIDSRNARNSLMRDIRMGGAVYRD
jgi:hypothetical protein